MSVESSVKPRSSARLVGLDLFRAVAVFGMLVAHVGPAAWTPGDGFGTVHVVWEFFHSRMPAMFAFAAGMSLNLGSRASADAARPAIAPTLIRAALLAACGIALSALRTPVIVILVFFAVWFVLVLPFRRLSIRALLIAAAAWAVLGPMLSLVLRRSIELPGNPLWQALVAGDYPALTWMPFVLAGLAVGRMDLASARVRVRLAVAGSALIGVGYGLSVLLLAFGLGRRIMDGLVLASGMDPLQQFARLFFQERGVTHTGSWLWLVAPAPHSGSWADVIGCLGVCALLLAILLPVGDATRWATGAAGRVKQAVAAGISAVATLGAMVLSVYVTHIVAMALITAVTGHSFAGAQRTLVLAGFTGGLLLFSGLWMRRHRQGPIEWLLGQGSALIERMGRRVSAGWSRQSQP